MKNVLLILLLYGLIYLQGCAMGYNSVLFVTKSNVGIDVDNAPPTAELSVGRVEGVVEPTFESGKTVPVMASFKPQSRGLISGEVAQTFSTGDAALAMASLYANADFCAAPHEEWDRVQEAFDSGVEVTAEPTLPGDLSFVKRDVQPVFFGTTTSLGVNVGWSGLATTFPDNAHIGFRRKELALAPIAYEEKGGTGKLRAPSLLATIDQSVEVETPRGTRLRWLQYFATGKSATALALRQDVRKAMLTRLDPEQFAAVLAGESTRGFGVETLNNLYTFVASQAEGGEDARAVWLRDSLNKMVDLLPESSARYTWGSTSHVLTEDQWPIGSLTHTFWDVTSYWANLQTSVDALGEVVKGLDEEGESFSFEYKEAANAPVPGDQAVQEAVRAAESRFRLTWEQFDEEFRQSAAVRDAANYLRDLFR